MDTATHVAGTGTDSIDWVGRAKALRSVLEDAGPRCDANCELPPEVVEKLHEAGLFRLLIPQDLGGAEVDLLTFSAVIEAIGEGDGSAAWCLGQNAVSNMTSAYIPREAAQKMFADHRTVISWGAGINGPAVETEGGFRLSGQWSFASGSRHATWLGGQAFISAPDGTRRLEQDGTPKYRTFVFPKSYCQITADWNVFGLRGTGSDSYVVTEAFVPDSHQFSRVVPAPHPGALYRIPLAAVYPVAFASVALGLARAILDSFIDMARNKVPRGLKPMRDSEAIWSLLGQAATRLNSARTNLRQLLGEVHGLHLDSEWEIRLRSSTTFAIHEAVSVADILFHEAGATAILVSQPFERRYRDLHALAQQVQARRANFEKVGQYLLGLETGPLFI